MKHLFLIIGFLFLPFDATSQENPFISGDRLSPALERHGAIVLIIDPDTGAILDANKTASAFYGYPIDKLRRMRIQNINILNSQEVKSEYEAARAEKRNYFIFPHRLADGSVRTVEVYSSPFTTLSNKNLLLSIIHDITDKRIAEDEIVQYKTRLEELVAERTREVIDANARSKWLTIIGSILVFGLLTALYRRTQKALFYQRQFAFEQERKLMLERFEYLTRYANDIILLMDEHGEILEANERAVIAYGYPKEELLKMNIRKIRDPIKSPDYESVQNLARLKNGYLYEAWHTRRDGKPFPVESSIRQFKIHGQLYFQHIIRDITNRKQSEAALKEAHQRLLTVLNNINAIVYVIDMESYEILFVNQHVRDKLGDIEGKKCWSAIQVGKTGPCSFCTNTKLVDHKGNPTGVYRWEFRNPKTGKWYDCHDSAIKWIDGRMVRLEVAIDISQRKQAERKYRKWYTLMQYIIQHDPNSIAVFDKDLRYIFVSERYLKDYRIKEENIIGKHHYEVFPDVPEKWREVHQRSLSGEVISSEDDYFIREDGSVDYTRWQCRPWYNFNNSIGGIILYTEVITERKLLEKQLLQAQKMESVGRLAGGVAHDINNMLMVIMGYAELGLGKVDSGEFLFDCFDEIITASKRSSEITRQLLAFARKQTITPLVCNLNEVVKNMLKMLRRLIGENIDIVWIPGYRLWPVKLEPAQIDQVLANLCVNARDAITGTGKIIISTENIDLDENYCSDHAEFLPGQFVLLAVSDNGHGIDKEMIDNIFDPFFTTKELGKGTGLGLATVYGIVKQNKGFINVYSEPGKGTTFKIYFPRFDGTMEAPVETGSEFIPQGRGEVLLLVEDEPSIMKMSKTILDNLGYQVLTANTPGEAVYLAEKNSGRIHLLITDVVMPEMNGRDLANQICTRYPNIKTLFMSGYSANVIAHHGVLDKGVQFIQKPFSKKDIAIKIRKVLEQFQN